VKVWRYEEDVIVNVYQSPKDMYTAAEEINLVFGR